jgi:dolichol-phosphate mannosyltransferase
MKTLLVVLPTYNERQNLTAVAEGVLRHPWTRLLVVDDQSPDGTGLVADELAGRWPGRLMVRHRTGPRGLGRAYVEGLGEAIASGADAIGQMDADLSHDPAALPALFEALGRFDVVIGSRYVPGGRIENWPRRRVLLSAFANRYIRLITGLASCDCTSGFRLWRREALADLPVARARAGGYAFLTEMLYEAARAGRRIGEVPITFVERRAGQSKVTVRVLVESLLTPLRLARRGRIRAS